MKGAMAKELTVTAIYIYYLGTKTDNNVNKM